MAQLDYSFNSDDVEPMMEFDVLPTGWYPAQVIESDIVPTKAGTGKILKLTFEIVEGQFQARKVWANINIINQSTQAQEIGQRELSSLCKAVGIPVVDDTEQLHWIPFSLHIGQARDNQSGDIRNVVKGYRPYGQGAAPSRPPSAPAQQQGRAPAASQAASQAAPAGGPPGRVAGGGSGNRPWNRGQR